MHSTIGTPACVAAGGAIFFDRPAGSIITLSKSSLVSIVIPVFNGANYLAEAIESALSQTYPYVEIIVVNDGSTDNGATRAIAKSYGDRIRYIEQENQGVSGALNTGIDNMRGEFFCWLSHDDLFVPEKTAVQIEAFQKIGRKDVILFGDYGLINEYGGVIAAGSGMDHALFVSSPRMALLRGAIYGCATFIPRAAFDVARFDPSLRYTQDYALWAKLSERYSFVHLAKCVAHHRFHASQTSKQPRAVQEGEELWRRLIDSKDETERALIAGSSQRFFQGMAELLERTPYKKAGAYARQRTKAASAPLVSIIIPFFNEVTLARRAARSACLQTYDNLEVILVDDGSTDSIAPLEEFARTDHRVRILRQPNAGAGSARNMGIDVARGEYIAFLDADDCFVPTKLQIQVGEMQRRGALFSHTSYQVVIPDRPGEVGLMRSGRFGGYRYPEIIADCPIATPTVIIHRSLLASGLRFREGHELGEDILFWIQIARGHPILGIDQPLSVVEWTPGSAIMNATKGLKAVGHMLETFSADPEISKHQKQIRVVRASLAALSSGPERRSRMNEPLIETVVAEQRRSIAG